MKSPLRILTWLLGLVPLGFPPTMTALAEGSKQLTPNTPATAALPLTDPANTRSGYLEHDANFTGAGVSGANRAFLKPYNFNYGGRFTYSDDQRMYVLLKPGETIYYGLHRTPHAQGTGNQSNLIVSARYSLDGRGAGTLGRQTKIFRDSSTANSTAALRQSAFLNTVGGVPQPGVIASAAEAQAGPKVAGSPAAGYAPLSFTNSTGSNQWVWFEFVQPGETLADGSVNTAFTDGQRFSVYDFWDFTVKTSTGVEKPGRLFSKQWGFSAGQTDGRFSSTFNMFPLIPSPKEAGKYFVKKFELAGLAPQNFFRFVANSQGADPTKVTPNTFANTAKSQTTEIDYPEYLSFVNNPDPEIWPSAADPDLKVISTASYCKGTGGVMEFFLSSTLGASITVDIELNGTPGYQAGTRDRQVTATIPVGNSRVEWDGRDGLGAVVASGTPLSLTFKNSISPIAPVNFPVWDAENNISGFRIQNIRPGFQGFEVLYWDDSNLDAAKFPETAATPRVQLTGAPSINGVHTWGGTAAPTLNAGDVTLVNTYTYGDTEQQTRNFTFNYVCDPDGDGVADNVDVDQDNDGITNASESGGVDPAFITANNVPRYLDAFESNFVDVNADGVNDVYDFDLDGRPNFLDIDADNDGIPDAIEANGGTAPTGYVATTGRIGGTISANGMPASAQTAANSGVTNLPLTNTDNLGRPDYFDIDADNDGIVDNIEAQTTAAYRAPSGLDADLDGLDNAYDPTPGGTATAGTAVPIANTDGADLPDYRDLNSDNDSRTDAVEGWDTNNDGVAEKVASGIDADGDGLDDAFDNDTKLPTPTNGQLPTSFPDNDTATTERAWREVFTAPTIAAITISGRIFEDVNYGGGAGRDFATANTSATASGFVNNAIGRTGVTVELYDASGAFVSSAVTTAGGAYSFALVNKPAGDYTVRVVSSTGFTSVRGTATGLLPVQTYAYGVSNKVGGEVPSKVDAPARSGVQTLTDITSGATATAQSLTTITVPAASATAASVTNIDFGFNFDLIVNTNDAGQGSLRQFILNSNALLNTNLDQVAFNNNGTVTGADPAAGIETSIFMIADGRLTNVPAGLRSGVSGGASNGVATVTLTTSSLPNITDANTALDGSKQTTALGNSSAAVTTNGAESTGPEVIINFNTISGLVVTGGSTRIASVGLTGAQGTAGTTAGAGIIFSGATVTGSSLIDVTSVGNATAGARLQNNATGVNISNNVLRASTTSGALIGQGLSVVNASGNAISGNTISGNAGYGISFSGTTNDGNTISGNTISGNGIGAGSTQTSGISIQVGTNNTISTNTISGNVGNGIVALNSTSANTFSRNIISANTLLGIDLSAGSAAAGDGVTLNDNGDTDTGANGLLNFPVITSATIVGNNLIVRGYARAGSLIELFNAGATPDPTGFGEGQTYLTTVTEGTGDIDARTGLSYSGTINGGNQGSDNSANGFTFGIPLSSLPGGTLAAGARLTSTATLAGATSEFSGNVVVVAGLVANDDQAITPSDTPITFAVTGNDTGDFLANSIDLDPNTAAIETSFTTPEGTFTTVGVAVGSVKFTPVNATFVGIANTPYTVRNAAGTISNQANLIVKVETQLDLATTITTATGTSVTAGAPTTIEGTTSNFSTTSIAGIMQYVQLPVGLSGTFILSRDGGASSAAAYDPATGIIAFPSLTLAAGASSTWSVTFTPPGSGPFAVNAFVNNSINAINDVDIKMSNNATSIVLNVTPRFDLATSLSGPATTTAGSLATYSIVTRNLGPSPAAAAVQTVQVPANLAGVYVTNGGTYDKTSGVVTFPTVSLANGTAVNNTVSFTVPATTFTPSATVTPNTTATGDPVPANNVAYLNGATGGTPAAVVAVSAAPAALANLYVTVSGPAQVAGGATATYTVTQGNNGPSAASNVQTTVSLPLSLTTTTLTVGGVTGSQAGGSTLITFGTNGPTYETTTGVLTLPTLATQASAATPTTYTVALTAPVAGASPALTVTAAVQTTGATPTTADPVPADNVATVQTKLQLPVDLAVSVVVNNIGAANLLVGQTALYTVRSVNNSSIAAQNVQQTLRLPARLDGTSLRLNGVAGTVSGLNVTFANGAVYNGGTGQLTLPLVATLDGGAGLVNSISFITPFVGEGRIQVQATVEGTVPDAVPGNNTASLLNGTTPGNGVSNSQDETVFVSGPAQATVGNPAYYIITTSNNGPASASTQSTLVQLPTGLPAAGFQLNDAAGTLSAGVITFTDGATYTQGTGVLKLADAPVGLAGFNTVNTVEFITPDVAQLSVAASVTAQFDQNLDNNSARVSTPVVVPNLSSTDLVTTISRTPTGTQAVGTDLTYAIMTTNSGPVAASQVVQTVSLPANLLATNLRVANSTGTLSAGVITFGTNGPTYVVATGVLTFPAVATLTTTGAGAAVTNTVQFALPATGAFVTATSAAANNPEPTPADNTIRNVTDVTTQADVATLISGPATTVAGATVAYSVATTNNGPTTAAGVKQTFVLPSGVTSYSLNGGAAVAVASGATITLLENQTFTNGETRTNVVSFVAPTSNSFNVSGVSSTTSPDLPATNNSDGVTTTLRNLAPVANDVVNKLQSPEGNTAVTNLPLSPLSAADLDGGSINSYTIRSIPNATTQGVLRLNGSAVTTDQPITTLADIANLTFDPVDGFVGSVFFTYTATDNGNGFSSNALASNVARYTIQVGQDNASGYTFTPAKGGATSYATNDVLAFVIDANGAKYNSTGAIYNATTGLNVGGSVSNGLPTTGTNAVLAASGQGPTQNPTNALPAGVSLNPITGQIYVSNASQLPRVTTKTTYYVNVTTTDLFGGTNTALAQFDIGAYPLPVSLTAFEATAEKLNAVLSWTTATEKNNDHFVVARSLDGVSYAKIGQVAGQGSKASPTTYTLTDAGIGAKASGSVYYRLQQVDKDGTSTYSPVRVVSFTKAAAPTALAISLYPVPVPSGANATLDLTALPATSRYAVSLTDLSGRTVGQYTLAGGQLQPLAVGNLASGSYLLTLSGADAQGQVLRLVKRFTKE